MSKSKFIQHKILSKTSIALISVLVAVFGFLFSRALLSVGIFVLGINTLRGISPRQWLKNKWWLVTVCWIATYAISWFWTDDKADWGYRLGVKPPMLLLPLAFGFLPAFSVRQLKIFTIVSSLILLCTVAYSLYFFALTPADYIYGYSVSHVLPTLPPGDHIRTSLVIALFIIWCFYFFRYAGSALMKWFLGIVITIFIVYLHILAARTGLLAFYVFIILYAIYIARKNKILGLSIFTGLVVLAISAYNFSPTLKNRIDYFTYTITEYKYNGLQGNYSDMGRFISYDIALKKISQNWLIGVGTGDVFTEMKKGYDAWYPQVNEEARLMPHNQFLIVAMACGLPALLIFIIAVFMPLAGLKRDRSGFFFFSVWLVMLLPLTVEPMLEIQFGVFVYLFFLLWQRHVMLHPPVIEE